MATKKTTGTTETVKAPAKKPVAKKATTEKKPVSKKLAAKKVVKAEVTDKPVKPKRVKNTVDNVAQVLETLVAVPEVQTLIEPAIEQVLEQIISVPTLPVTPDFEEVLFKVNWALVSDEDNNYASALEILEQNHTVLIDVVQALTSYSRSRLSFAAKHYRFKFKTNRINFWTTMHQMRQVRSYVKA